MSTSKLYVVSWDKELNCLNFSGNVKHYVQSVDEAKAIMEKDNKAIFFNNRETELGLEGYPCLIRTAKFSYLKSPIAFAFQKNSPYTKLFSHFLLKMRESGEVTAIYRKHLNALKDLKHRNDVCSRKSEECLPGRSDCVPPVGIKTVCTAGLIVMIGIGLGVGIAALEFSMNRTNHINYDGNCANGENGRKRIRNQYMIVTCVSFVVVSSAFMMMLFSYVMFYVSHEQGDMDLNKY